MSRTALLACTAVLGLGLGAGAAHAADWRVTVGGEVNVSPPYEGSGHYVTVPSPNLSISRADKPYRFSPPDDPTTLSLLSTQYVEFGPEVRFQYGRGAKGQLLGFQRLHPAVEPGAFLNLYPVKWFRLHGELRRGVYGHDGWVGDAGVDVIAMTKRWDFSLGPRVGYGDKNYFDAYFAVTPQEAAQSKLVKTAYDPDGGQRYTGVEFGTSYHLTSRLFLIGGVGYHQLSEKAADSPLVRIVGSRDQYFGTVGFTWTFGFHS